MYQPLREPRKDDLEHRTAIVPRGDRPAVPLDDGLDD
jgi:hypothetical protein